MTAEERLAVLVRAGIYTPDGKLTERFKGLLGEDDAESDRCVASDDGGVRGE